MFVKFISTLVLVQFYLINNLLFRLLENREMTLLCFSLRLALIIKKSIENRKQFYVILFQPINFIRISLLSMFWDYEWYGYTYTKL